ncbi:hypothetical protein H6F88_19230 [Oculatella sp. FACHB-28]|uniref:hypothetical protein n=1 Tax=Oculatella sp. FACHB-28 TaxID=2692845 RepID=UPI001685C7DA|nr:hypothetical protein [Oculatella sp. FACHB-28]MBD2058119.1 hypothetical protein [Oculatella sp. FACHB-28]
MKAYLELLENLKTLEAERVKISGEGDVLFDCWIAQSKPGGTARTNTAHWQLRSRKAQFNGRKSKYLKASEVGQYEAAIARAEQLKKLNWQIEAVQKRISKVEAVLAAV